MEVTAIKVLWGTPAWRLTTMIWRLTTMVISSLVPKEMKPSKSWGKSRITTWLVHSAKRDSSLWTTSSPVYTVVIQHNSTKISAWLSSTVSWTRASQVSTYLLEKKWIPHSLQWTYSNCFQSSVNGAQTSKHLVWFAIFHTLYPSKLSANFFRASIAWPALPLSFLGLLIFSWTLIFVCYDNLTSLGYINSDSSRSEIVAITALCPNLKEVHFFSDFQMHFTNAAGLALSRRITFSAVVVPK